VILDEGWLRPGLPPITDPVPSADSWSDEHPPQASRSLLERTVLPSQVTIAVTSSKGGSGKTTVSVMLAATVARASSAVGRRLSVVVVDLDTYHGQVSSLVGTFMPTALNIRVQPDWDEDCIRRSIVSDPSLDIDVLLAPVRPRTADIVGPTFYRSIVQSLKRMYDVVILDTGNHYLDPLVADVALVEADAVLFVTTLASTSVQGMARALRELTDSPAEAGLGVPRDSIGIVVNQAAGGVGSDSDTLVTAGLGIPIVGVIPLATRDVLRATNASRMADLLDHPLLGPAYTDLARACLPNRALAPWRTPEFAGAHAHPDEPAGGDDHGADGPERRGLFRR
jgi:cellulose biosynthesis protein BcsQ